MDVIKHKRDVHNFITAEEQSKLEWLESRYDSKDAQKSINMTMWGKQVLLRTRNLSTNKVLIFINTCNFVNIDLASDLIRIHYHLNSVEFLSGTRSSS